MGRVRQKDPSRVDVIFLGDQHIPKEHKPSIEATFTYIRTNQPDHIFLLGDLGDMEPPSRYKKHHRALLETQDCLDAMREYLKKVRQAAPDAKITYRLGNHEDRWNNYLLEHPVITDLRMLSYSSLLGLEDFDIELIPYNATHVFNGLSIEHGDLARKKAGYSAAGMLEKRGISGIMGHTHRLAIHHKTTMAGVKFWIENGCLCEMDQGYIHGSPDWQHGFTAGYWSERWQRWFLNVYPIHDGVLLTDDTSFYYADK